MSIIKSKGQDQTIRAFAVVNKDFPDTELYIAGTGNKRFKEKLLDICRNRGLKNKVHFIGYVDDPFEFFEKIDVALTCSTNEAMGRVTVEAMVAGKVIIGLDNGGTSELIIDGVTGHLYSGSTKSLAKKMQYVLENDQSSIKKQTREQAIKKFNNEDYANNVVSVLSECHY